MLSREELDRLSVLVPATRAMDQFLRGLEALARANGELLPERVAARRPEDELFLNLLSRTFLPRRVISPRAKCHGSERAPTVCKSASDDYARQQGEPALQDLQRLAERRDGVDFECRMGAKHV